MSSTPTSAERSSPPEGIHAVAADTATSATSHAVATPVAQFLSVQQAALLQRIAESNTPGNLEGLFAFHVIGPEPAFPLTWDVNCATEEWLASNASRLSYAPTLAVMGYVLFHFGATAPQPLRHAFSTGIGRLRQRNSFPEDRMSFAYRPVEFLGLALGALALREEGAPHRAWLIALLDDPRCASTSSYHDILIAYIRHQLTGDDRPLYDLQRYRDTAELAVAEWGIRCGALRLDRAISLSQMQSSLLQAAVTSDLRTLDAPRAAIVWSAVHAALVRGVDALTLSPDHVATALRRFEAALRRWRWDDPRKVKKHPIHWPIVSEREVQDIVWLILRSLCDDVVDEETLPKVGHSTYRADFGIPSLRLLVEVKYCRQAADFKSIEKEILEDTVAYLVESRERYDRILVFIYDHSSSVQEHAVTTSSLSKIPEVTDVIIVSRPSQLPFELAEENQEEEPQ